MDETLAGENAERNKPMTTDEINEYYDATANREARADLAFAVQQCPSELGRDYAAVDCGCGAGADIAYLRENGFSVHGFDIEEESIRRCRRGLSMTFLCISIGWKIDLSKSILAL